MRRFLSAALVAFFCCASIAVAGTRVIVMPGENPRSIDQNGAARFERLDKGTWRKDALGTVCTTGAYANLSVVPNGGMYVAVQPTAANTEGSLYQMGSDDTNPIPQGSWSSSLAADNTQICIHGMQAGPSASIGPITAPGSGSNQYFLVEAQIQSVDNNSQSVLFINSNNSSSFQTVNTNRVDAIVYQIKAGVVNGSAPSADSGWIGIANVLVPGGTSTITSGMISALSAFGGFIGNGTNVTLNGLTLNGFSSGCLNTNSSGVVSVAACTGGLGTVNGTNPIQASTVSGTATVSCPTCVTSVGAAGPLSSSGGTAPQISLTGTVPLANLPSTIAQTNANNNFSVLQTIAAASVTGNTSTGSLNVSSYSVGNASATPPPQTGNNGAYVVAQATAAPTQQPGNVNVAGLISNAATSLAVQSGTNGPVVVAQATSAPTAQPGNINITGTYNTGSSSLGATSATVNGPIHLTADGSGNLLYGGTTQVGLYSGSTVQGVNGGLFGLYNNTAGAFRVMVDTSGNAGFAGNVTAANFIQGSRRDWKKNIVPFQFDALNLLNQVDFKEYDCKTDRCGPAGVHKVGIIADDSPWQVSGKKHDHYDAFAMAAIDGKAIVELHRQVEVMLFALCAMGVVIVGMGLTLIARGKRA